MNPTPDVIKGVEKKGYLPEIELKYLCSSPPFDLSPYPSTHIRQGYLEINDDGSEVRIRQTTGREGERYFIARKIGKGKTRQEDEHEISPETFEALWPTVIGIIEKIRYHIPYGPNIIEFDRFLGEHKDLLLAEVEFSDETSANLFMPPEWMETEVTENGRYKNAWLASHRIPPHEPLQPPQKQEYYQVEEGVEAIIAKARELYEQGQKKIVICVAGGSNSGKTSNVAYRIQRALGEHAYLGSLDDLYNGNKFLAQMGHTITEQFFNWDHPDSVDTPHAVVMTHDFRNGQSIVKPEYDPLIGERTGMTTIDTSQINFLILEGLFALDHRLASECDIGVFVQASAHGRLLRKLCRDVVRFKQPPKDLFFYFATIVHPMHNRYIERSLPLAQFVLQNEYDASKEASRIETTEQQVKYRVAIASEQLRQLGAEHIASVTQHDTYYNPDRDLSATGESLRIREEGGQLIFTYKGPRIPSTKANKLRKRAKLEFTIDPSLRDALLQIYPQQVLSISKTRDIYLLGGFPVTHDVVHTTISGQPQRELGEFLEVRFPSNIASERIEELLGNLARLGIHPKDAILDSYFDLAHQT